MKIVIDIPEKEYELVKHGNKSYTTELELMNAVAKGTPLPKGHGRIMDVDKIIKKMEEREEQLKDDMSIWETASVETALDIFGETIIEPNKESEK